MKKADRCLLWTSVFGYLVLSVSVLLMPKVADAPAGSLWRVLPGGLFWGGLLLGSLFQILLALRYRSWRRKQGIKKKGRVGLIGFFRTPLAREADVLLVVSGSALLVVMLFVSDAAYICYVLLGLTIFAFCMHCILNGRVFCSMLKRKALDK